MSKAINKINIKFSLPIIPVSFLVLFVLKLTETIATPWVMVFIWPFLIFGGLCMTAIIFFFIIAVILALFGVEVE